MLSAYGQPFAVSGFDAGTTAHGLARVSFARNGLAGSGYNEAWLQNLIAAHPELLPIEALEPSLRDARAICTEMPTPAGYVDNVFMTDRGELILVECKLWRNPEARREVVGQILDYAKELSRWDYTTLETAVKRSTPTPGNAKSATLYQRAGSPDGLDEAGFVDTVSRNLSRGRFLLLIVGDGIQEGVRSMTEFLQLHAALHFTLGIVELAIFALPEGAGHIVQPRILTRTTMIERGIVELSDDRIQPRMGEGAATIVSAAPRASVPIARTISEEMLFEELDGRRPGSAAQLKAVVNKLSELGVIAEMLPTALKLNARHGDVSWPLGTIAKEGSVWLDSVLSRARASGQGDAAMEYYRSLAGLIDDPQVRDAKLNPTAKSGIASLPLTSLLDHADRWFTAVDEYLRALGDTTEG